MAGRAGDGTNRMQLSSTQNMKMTQRGTEILRLIVFGYSNKEISLKLNLSPSTVLRHRERIYKAMNCHCLIAIIRKAILSGTVTMKEFLSATGGDFTKQ